MIIPNLSSDQADTERADSDSACHSFSLVLPEAEGGIFRRHKAKLQSMLV